MRRSYNLQRNNVQYGLVKISVVPAAVVVGLVLVLTSCTQLTGQQPPSSPEVTPSTSSASPTPSTSPTPTETSTPGTSPSPKPSASPAKLIITSLPFHMGEVGLSYGTVVLGAAGGVKPYKWSISSGALPPGLTLLSGGSTTGKPTTVGTFSFVVRVDDSAGAAAGVSRSILVFRQIAFTATTGTCSAVGNPVSCTTRLTYTGGASATPKISVTQTPKYPPLPKGSSFTAKSGVVTVTVPGPACNTPNYDAVVTLVLVDQSPCGAGFNCQSGKLSLTIQMSNNC
jgi:hypothetical protein